MYRHFYPVIGTFVGERTLLKKKRTFWGTFFKKGYNPVLGVLLSEYIIAGADHIMPSKPITTVYVIAIQRMVAKFE